MKTTMYLDEKVYRRLRQIARQRGTWPALVVREALAEYVARHPPKRRPRSLGQFKSGRTTLGERAEAMLAGFGEDA